MYPVDFIELFCNRERRRFKDAHDDAGITCFSATAYSNSAHYALNLKDNGGTDRISVSS